MHILTNEVQFITPLKIYIYKNSNEQLYIYPFMLNIFSHVPCITKY